MLFLLLTGCFGVNVSKVPNQEIYLDDGEAKQVSGPYGFAVVGDSRRPPVLEAMRHTYDAAVLPAIVSDISNAAQDDSVHFLVHMGDMVSVSNTKSWKNFSRDWSLLIAGTEVNEAGVQRIRALPVAGERDATLDSRLKGWGAAFQGAGADIGYNRVGSWYTSDLSVDGHVWRLLVLDSNKDSMGSRWTEEVRWLQSKALEGDFDSLLVFMHNPLLTLSSTAVCNEAGAPKELLAIIEDKTKFGSLKAVFSANTGSSEVFLPSGKLGELYVNAGGGGAPPGDQSRWGDGTAAGFADIRLEPIFDLALVREFDRWSEAKSFPENIIDKGRGQGSYEGFVASLDAKYFPVQGWWNVVLNGAELQLDFHMVGMDGSLKTVYTVQRDPKTGWKIGR